MERKMTNVKKMLYSILVVVSTAFFCSYFTKFGINGWYQGIEKTSLTPPDSVFPIVWNILYVLMIIAFYLILKSPRHKEYKTAKTLFLSQLVLQIIWCFLFFYNGFIGLALGIIFLLDFIVWKTMFLFRKINPTAYYLMLPYFIWLCFASLLNFSFIVSQGLIVVF